MEQTIRVPLLAFDGISVNLERSGGKSNYDAILRSLEKFESGEKPAEAKPEGGKTFVIDELRITDVNAKVTYALLGASKSTVSVVVPEIRLKNVGTGSGGVGLGEIASVVTKALLQAIAQAGIVPADILKDLTSGLRGLANVDIDLPEGVKGVAGKLLSGDTDAVVEELGEKAKSKLGQKLDEATGGQAEELGKTIEGLGGLLGGKKQGDQGN
jgi:hypothetical protein